MFAHANEVFVHRPNLYLGLMTSIAAAMPILVLWQGQWGLGLIALLGVAFLFLMGRESPPSAKDDAWQRRVERQYRLVRLLTYAVFVLSFFSLTWWPPAQLGHDVHTGLQLAATMASFAAAKNVGQHIRFCWMQPETNGAVR